MLVTPAGILTLFRRSHPKKASAPMQVTLFGIVTLVKRSHPENAL
jgi:hypothetical protein